MWSTPFVPPTTSAMSTGGFGRYVANCALWNTSPSSSSSSSSSSSPASSTASSGGSGGSGGNGGGGGGGDGGEDGGFPPRYAHGFQLHVSGDFTFSVEGGDISTNNRGAVTMPGAGGTGGTGATTSAITFGGGGGGAGGAAVCSGRGTLPKTEGDSTCVMAWTRETGWSKTHTCASGTDECCRCTCDVGFWGVNCAFGCPMGGVSNSEACSGHGACHATTGGCGCVKGYFGANCGSECPGGVANPCSGHGACDPIGGACACAAGYTGAACDKECTCEVANTVTCSASDTPSELPLVCGCKLGFVGDTCAIACSRTVNCAGNGECFNPSTWIPMGGSTPPPAGTPAGTCLCDGAYEGDGCENRVSETTVLVITPQAAAAGPLEAVLRQLGIVYHIFPLFVAGDTATFTTVRGAALRLTDPVRSRALYQGIVVVGSLMYEASPDFWTSALSEGEQLALALYERTMQVGVYYWATGTRA